jgi:hypothetical protein
MKSPLVVSGKNAIVSRESNSRERGGAREGPDYTLVFEIGHRDSVVIGSGHSAMTIQANS